MSQLSRAAIGMLAAVVLAGCSDGPRAAPVVPDQARAALKTTLDAWKAGRPIESMSQENPPIVAQDFDWMAGAKLLDYQLEDEGQALDANLKVRVKLTVRDAKGATNTKTVNYIVGTDPKVTVFRGLD